MSTLLGEFSFPFVQFVDGFQRCERVRIGNPTPLFGLCRPWIGAVKWRAWPLGMPCDWHVLALFRSRCACGGGGNAQIRSSASSIQSSMPTSWPSVARLRRAHVGAFHVRLRWHSGGHVPHPLATSTPSEMRRRKASCACPSIETTRTDPSTHTERLPTSSANKQWRMVLRSCGHPSSERALSPPRPDYPSAPYRQPLN